MTATSEFIDAKTETRRVAQEVGFASLLRWTFRFVGAALIIAALGLWLAPGSTFDGDVIMMKLGVTFFFGLTGLTFMMGGGKR